jgi:hypothetical protein
MGRLIQESPQVRGRLSANEWTWKPLRSVLRLEIRPTRAVLEEIKRQLLKRTIRFCNQKWLKSVVQGYFVAESFNSPPHTA